MPNCGKSYGSEGSLNQHMKIKHFEMMKEDKGLKESEIKEIEESEEEDENNHCNRQKKERYVTKGKES